jgi:hypothetical protein
LFREGSDTDMKWYRYRLSWSHSQDKWKYTLLDCRTTKEALEQLKYLEERYSHSEHILLHAIAMKKAEKQK